MTKRLIAAFLILVLMVAAVGCGVSNVNNTDNANTTPDPDQPAAEIKKTILSKEGEFIGEIDSRANCTAVDGGIFYSIFELGDGQFTANAEYHFFNKDTKQDVLLGTLEEQGYEALYSRTEYNGTIYTLAIAGNPMSGSPVPLVLLASDPASGTMKKYTVSKNGFAYASMAVSNGKLLIMNHETSDPRYDKIYEFDPATGKIKEVLKFTESKNSLRGVCAASDGIFLLRLKVADSGENELFLDRYDNNYKKMSERSVNEVLLKATMDVQGILDRQDALNELGMSVSRFSVDEDRYLIYENFGLTRLMIDLYTDEALFVMSDIYSVSQGSGAPFFYKKDLEDQEVTDPEIMGMIDGTLVNLDFKPEDSHKLIREVSHSSGGTWLIMTSDGYHMWDSSFVLYLWTE